MERKIFAINQHKLEMEKEKRINFQTRFEIAKLVDDHNEMRNILKEMGENKKKEN
jgi:hypothetical protein